MTTETSLHSKKEKKHRNSGLKPKNQPHQWQAEGLVERQKQKWWRASGESQPASEQTPLPLLTSFVTIDRGLNLYATQQLPQFSLLQNEGNISIYLIGFWGWTVKPVSGPEYMLSKCGLLFIQYLQALEWAGLCHHETKIGTPTPYTGTSRFSCWGSEIAHSWRRRTSSLYSSGSWLRTPVTED